MPYAIMVSHQGQGAERIWEPTDIIFEDGSQAGAYVKNENSFSAAVGRGWRYRAIKIGIDDPLAWRHREQQRFDNGTYQLVPWTEQYSSTGMFEHIDPDNPTQVRFIASEVDGLQGRYTSMSPGRFIRRYLDNNPYPPYIDRWCAQMGLDLTVSELKIARSAEEIVFVYNSGPHSCMAYDTEADVFRHLKGVHPCAVYGDSDVGVAYIERGGDITARCLVWPDKKIHSRIYGDEARLLERLIENDYVKDWKGFAGAKIRQIRVGRKLVLPYIDGVIGVVMEGEEWLTLSHEPNIIARSPQGIPVTYSCQRCGAKDVVLKEDRGPEGDDEPEYTCVEGCNE